MSCCLTFVLQLRFLLPRVIHCRRSGFRKISRAKRHKSEEKIGRKGGFFPSYLFPCQIKKSCNSKSCFHQHSVVGNKKVFENLPNQEKMPVDFEEEVCETNKGQAFKSQWANCCLSPQIPVWIGCLHWILDPMFKNVISKFMSLMHRTILQ